MEVKEDPVTKNIKVRVEDTLAGEMRNLEFDLLVLATGIVPNEGIGKIQQLLKLSKAADGLLMEAHPKLKPVDTTIDGVFLAGCASGPKDIPYAVSQGSACAGRATIFLKNKKAITEGITAVVNPDVCVGCEVCIPMCPFQAIKFDEKEKRQMLSKHSVKAAEHALQPARQVRLSKATSRITRCLHRSRMCSGSRRWRHERRSGSTQWLQRLMAGNPRS